ncbi:hypothetical protein ABW19_dt0203436 [Dactylella cylindrospora]|nr:hypothetical protein ABW19_dt0203436 [Dactylella cylindrospora]
MATLSTIPLEIYLLITFYLSSADLLSLRLCSKGLNSRTEDDHLEKLFGARRYFMSEVDLNALVRFARHPSKKASRLKTLTLDMATPYLPEPNSFMNREMSPAKFSEEFTEIFYLRDRRGVQSTLAREFRMWNESRDSTLVAIALQHLPNLETIEIKMSEVSDIPARIVASHFPEIRDSDKWDRFLQLYRTEGRGLRRDHSFERQLSLMIFGLMQAEVRPKTIRLLPGHPLLSIGLNWFADEEGWDVWPEWKPVFRDLETLGLNLTVPVETRNLDPVGDTKSNQMYLSRFLREVVPGVRTLSLHGNRIMDVGVVNREIGFFFAGDRTPWDEKYESYAPAIIMDDPKTMLRIPSVHTLTLSNMAFIAGELVNFLRSHRSSLRQLNLHNCLLQKKIQVWSPVFETLAYSLDLQSFRYETCFVESGAKGIKAIPWFRVYGNVREDGHYCELYPRGATTGARVRANFQTSLSVIQKLERDLIANSDWKGGEDKIFPIGLGEVQMAFAELELI